MNQEHVPHIPLHENKSLPPVERKFAQLCDDYATKYARLDPVVASAIGDRSQDHRLLDRVCEYRFPFPLIRERREAIKGHIERTRQDLQTINSDELNPHSQHFYRVLEWEVNTKSKLLENRAELSPFGSQQLGMLREVLLDASGKGRHSFKTVEDYENFITRMEEFPQWFAEAKENAEEGKSMGYTASQFSALATLNQVQHFLTTREAQDACLAPLRNMPEHFSPSDRQRLEKHYNLVFDQSIYNSFVLIHVYLQDYLSSCRNDNQLGMKYLPHGSEEYQRLARFHTSSSIGLSELNEMIDGELGACVGALDRLRNKAKFGGNIREFIRYMDTKLKLQYFSSGDELRSFHDRVNKKVKRLLPQLVIPADIPDYDLHFIEGEMAQTATAQHRKAGLDGSRKASVWIPLRPDPDMRIDNRPNMLRTIFHEGGLGHHLLSSLQERANVPAFLHQARFPAFEEGWPMHAESLGHKLLYPQNDELEFEIQYTRLCIARAAKFDMGMHLLGWSLEEVAQFRRRYFGEMGKGEYTDILRMNDWAAQVFSYFIGSPAISGLKNVLKHALKNNYDERVVNTALLDKGCMPLELLPLIGEEIIQNHLPEN